MSPEMSKGIVFFYGCVGFRSWWGELKSRQVWPESTSADYPNGCQPVGWLVDLKGQLKSWRDGHLVSKLQQYDNWWIVPDKLTVCFLVTPQNLHFFWLPSARQMAIKPTGCDLKTNDSELRFKATASFSSSCLWLSSSRKAQAFLQPKYYDARCHSQRGEVADCALRNRIPWQFSFLRLG